MPSPLLFLGIIASVGIGFVLWTEVIEPAIKAAREEEEAEQRYAQALQARSAASHGDMPEKAYTSALSPEPLDGEMRQRRRASGIPLVDLLSPHDEHDARHHILGSEPSRSRHSSFADAFDRLDSKFEASSAMSGRVRSGSGSGMMAEPHLDPQRDSPPLSAISSFAEDEMLSELEELEGVASVRSLSDAGSAGMRTSDEDFITVTDTEGSWSELAAESSSEEEEPLSGRQAAMSTFLHQHAQRA